MNLRFAVLSLVLLSIVTTLASGRVVAASSESSAVRIRVVIVDARLRSAFIQRATGLDRSRPPATFAAQQRELREHFDAVLAMLVANTARSLDTALDRLEQRRGEEWSDDERATWRQRLAEERLTNIRRLHRYQQHGRFPINEHASDRAVPVFVDNRDTACAVGHLMRESGWGVEVATIQAENNLVYVTDVADGPVVDWVATSGLTQEEAAIIQPGYGIAPAPDATLPFSATGASDQIAARGLKYSQFSVSDHASIFEGDFIERLLERPGGWSGVSDVSPTGSNLTAAVRYGLGWADGSFGGESFVPLYDRWLNIYPDLGRTQRNQMSFLTYEFEVSALEDDERIDSITLLSNYVIGNLGFGPSGGYGLAGFEVFSDTNQRLGFGHIEGDSVNSSSILRGRQVVSFAPRERVKVFVTVFTLDGYGIFGLGHEVNLISVPENSTWSMAIMVGCIAVPAMRSFQKRRTAPGCSYRPNTPPLLTSTAS